MNKLFYPKLAYINIKKNRKIYVPYILSCIGTIMMYFIMTTLKDDPGMSETYGGGQLSVILGLGTIVIGIFAIIFLFYTNSFLIKRRKKELGLFNILGMEKKHISLVLFFETLYTSVFSFVAGVGLGFLMSKLIKLALLKITHLTVQFGFYFSGKAVLYTLILFGIIFILCFLNTFRQVHLTNPIDLLRGGEKGEKEPKAKIITTILGVLALGIGYYLAITTDDPVSAVFVFFIAVVLVIIGTNLLFLSGSISLLKILRNKRSYYYKPNHFISVSGMIYRMKQNAVGLANICILSTMVLVVISSTVSLYCGMEDILRTRFARNIIVETSETSYEKGIATEALVYDSCKLQNAEPKNILKYRYLELAMNREDNNLNLRKNSDNNINCTLNMIPLKEYNEMRGENIVLAEDEILMFGNEKADKKSFKSGELTLLNNDFKIKNKLGQDKLEIAMRMGTMFEGYTLILSDDKKILDIYNSIEELTDRKNLNFKFAFDLDGGKSKQIAIYTTFMEAFENFDQGEGYVGVECAENSKDSFYTLYGGLLFIGIFFGLLFVMATVLIIYYKQISEGYEDKDRYEIMQKVGMSKREVKKSIRSQVLTVFFLPLITAGIHIAFAFPLITQLLSALNLTNVSLFGFVTLLVFLVFTVFYAVVYMLTAKVYYKIVRS